MKTRYLIANGHLGINEKELYSMNKHIPGNIDILVITF